jgi:hypothetical protein
MTPGRSASGRAHAQGLSRTRLTLSAPRTYIEMPPTREETIAAFHRYVNMSAPELDAWLAGPECKTAGTGVGLASGRRISAILKRNPGRKARKYDEEDVAHMRKVVAYCKRHLAQEDKLKATKSPDALEHTKSTISLKNWGHVRPRVLLRR